MTSKVCVAANAGDGAGGHVADGIAAGFAGGDADRGEAAHDGRRVFNVDEVKLNVLAGGDVADAVGIFLAEIGQHFELLGVETTEGNLDALHAGGVPESVGAFGGDVGVVEGAGGCAVGALAVVVALAVGAAAQAGFGEDAVFDFALLAQGDLVFEDVEFGGEGFGNAVAELRFPEGIAWSHLNTLKYIGIGIIDYYSELGDGRVWGFGRFCNSHRQSHFASK